MKILNVIRKIVGHNCSRCGVCSSTKIHIQWQDKRKKRIR